MRDLYDAANHVRHDDDISESAPCSFALPEHSQDYYTITTSESPYEPSRV